MEITNKRAQHTRNSTLGIFDIDDIPWGFVIEDEPRKVKVKGKTRVSAGRYKLIIRKVESNLTLSYRKKYPWFKYHIQLKDVSNFDYIYIHVGNTEAHSDGCQVIGLNAHIVNGEFINSESAKLYEKFYKLVYPKLEAGETIDYNIIDE